jgi:hypothetical protein
MPVSRGVVRPKLDCPFVFAQAIGKAEDISVAIGPIRVTTIGQAFHWMSRDEVLQRLALLITDGGGLTLVNPGKRRPQESWEPIANQIVEEFLGPRTRHPKSHPQEP